MSFSRHTLSALTAAAAVAKVNAAFGSAFSTGPTSSDTFIRESWATLVLPAVPSDNNGDLSLWVGMGTSAGDLIQSIAENYGTSDWSVYAYTLMETSDTTQEPIQASGSTADEGDHITMHYEYNDSTGNYTQTVLLNGVVVSTLSTSDGKAEGWGSAVECADETCGTVPAHKWINCSIILDSADTAYSDTLALGTDVEATMTSDDGITWTIGTISIPGWSFTSESVTDSTATTTASASSASSSGSSSYAASGASPSSGSSSSYGSSSSSYGASGASPSGASSSSSYGSSSGSSSYGASGASPSSGSSSSSYGGSSGSSSYGSSGASPSGTSSYGGSSGSSSYGASGASPSSGSSSYGSSTEGGSGSEAEGAPSAQPTGSWGSSSGGWSGSGSSTDGASGASPSSGASSWWGESDSASDGSEGWRRSRIMRHRH